MSDGLKSASTVAVAIDMQHVFADDDSPWQTPDFAGAEKGVSELIDLVGVQNTVFTRFIAPARPTGMWKPYYEQWPFALKPSDDPMWDIVPGLADRVTNPTVDAPTFGKWNRQLQGMIPAASRILLCGVSTDCCVLSTALGALESGVEVVVVADACAGLGPEDHQRALDAIALYAPLARVSTLAELVA